MISDLAKKLYTLTYYFSNYSMRFWDLLHGTDFSFIDTSAASDKNSPYYATPWASLFLLKRYIDRNLAQGRGRSVIDIGCGKGFMLLFFSRQKFKKVSGIEYDRRIAAIARRNLAAIMKKGKKLPDVYRGDAAAFRGYDRYDTFYLYNPFDRDTFEKTVRRIMESAKDSKKPLVIFYCNPLHDDVLLKYGWKERARFYYKTRVYVSGENS